MAFSVLDVYPTIEALSRKKPKRVEIILRSDVGRGPPPSWSLKVPLGVQSLLAQLEFKICPATIPVSHRMQRTPHVEVNQLG